MDLDGINLLRMVVEEGGFSAAARRLGVPANRLSRRIQKLEEALGIRLLHRTTRKLSLTTAGQTLVDSAAPALQTLESCWHLAQSHAEEPVGHLRIAAPNVLFDVVGTQTLAGFLARYPDISVEIALSDEQVDLFSTGFDVAFRAGPIHDENVVARPLLASPLILVASPRLLEQQGIPQSVEALSNLPCLALRSQRGDTFWCLETAVGKQTIELQARVTVNSMGALAELARAGVGIALIPERLVASDLNTGALVRILPDCQVDGGGVYVVYSSRHHPPAALRAFLDYVLDYVQEQGVGEFAS